MCADTQSGGGRGGSLSVRQLAQEGQLDKCARCTEVESLALGQSCGAKGQELLEQMSESDSVRLFCALQDQ